MTTNFSRTASQKNILSYARANWYLMRYNFFHIFSTDRNPPKYNAIELSSIKEPK